MDLKVLLVLVVLLICLSNNNLSYANTSLSREEDLDLERQLQILNKPPVKTIQTNEGDIIDCVDIHKQPAFDHPLLKDHKLQLKPSSFPRGLSKTSSKLKPFNIRFRREPCPNGTVPIKRTRKEDLIRTKSLSESPAVTTDDANGSGSHIVSVKMKGFEAPYYGAIGDVSAYNLTIAPDQASSTNIWIQSGPAEHINFITTGWKVSQQLYGDGLTRLFTYWTGSGYGKGCYNTLCPGFVVTNQKIGPDVPISPTSVRGGDQYFLQLVIYQDRKSGNWWLIIHNDITIGYWPKEIFSLLRDGAEYVAWGGRTHAGQNGISPPMGNGYKPDRRFKDTCHFKYVQYVNDENHGVTPNDVEASENVDKSGCYALRNNKYWGENMGYTFKFGGPGGNCGV